MEGVDHTVLHPPREPLLRCRSHTRGLGTSLLLSPSASRDLACILRSLRDTQVVGHKSVRALWQSLLSRQCACCRRFRDAPDSPLCRGPSFLPPLVLFFHPGGAKKLDAPRDRGCGLLSPLRLGQRDLCASR